MSSSVVGDRVVSCHVYLRYRGAEEDAADRRRLKLDLTPEAQLRVAQAISVGGDPVDLTPADIINYEMPRLGHQIPVGAELFARITPQIDTTPAVLRLVLTTEEGVQTVVPFTRRSLSPGTEGATAVWVSPHQCFTMTTVANMKQEKVRLSLERTFDFEGPVTTIAGDINLMRVLQPGTTIGIVPERGPIDTTDASVTLSEGYVNPLAVSMLDALRVIQDHTRTPVLIPDQMTVEGLADLVELAALLDGLLITGDMRYRSAVLTLPQSDLGPHAVEDVFRDQFTLGFVVPQGKQIDLPTRPSSSPATCSSPACPQRPGGLDQQRGHRRRHYHPRTRGDPPLDRQARGSTGRLHRCSPSRALSARRTHDQRATRSPARSPWYPTKRLTHDVYRSPGVSTTSPSTSIVETMADTDIVGVAGMRVPRGSRPTRCRC